jgi:hypothetical protein
VVVEERGYERQRMTVLRWVVLVLFWLLSLIGLAALVLVSLQP